MANAVPNLIARDARFGPLATLTERLQTLDVSKLLVYLIDLVEPQALPHLADQFHVMGLEGWNAALTDESRRTLIKSAIELHRYKGTPYAVRLAIEQMGLSGRPVEWFDYGGNPFHFKISAKIPVGRAFTDADWQTLLDRIEDAKNVRSRLEGVTLSAETSGTSHRALCTSGSSNILAYPAQPATVFSNGEKQPAIWTSARAELRLYPRQPSALTVTATRLAAQAIASTTISTLYPASA